MNYFKTKIKNDIFDHYSIGIQNIGGLSEKEKFQIIKNYLLMKEYSMCTSMEFLSEPEEALKCFKMIYNINLDLPDDSDDSLDLLFIEFICSFNTKVQLVFDSYFIEKIEDFVNDIFCNFMDERQMDYYFEQERR